ncbi:tail fiber domain-containing protein [Pantoea dispersa]|uniref:tail fiber domain-containing protein n=1 Tax=Pantoea dispersa TaxID=59814 RepID=UPI0028DF5A2E|nr:tail fiber domain-containing protein [Pantoea dispersa]MDT8852961.1 tail fiber domain-containing protein [Pantoea dispersa]
MPAGTIALTNNSATVTGSGTSFTTELKVNDFVVSTVGGVAYTLGVKSIESNTSLTLMENYTGPSASGQSWTPVPYGTMAAITAQLAAQVTYAIRGLNLDKANWQQVFTAPGNITVSLPDGTSWQGPSWAYMATQFGNKANTTDVLTKADNLASVTNKATARANLGVDYGTTAGTVAQGNDSRFSTVNGMTGGTVSGNILVSGSGGNGNLRATSGVHAAGNYSSTLTGTSMGWDTSNGISTFQNNKGGGLGGYVFRLINADNTAELYRFQFRNDGVGLAPGGWITGSDERIKTDIEDIDPQYALQSVLSLRHVTFRMRDKPDGNGGWVPGGKSAGYLAQDLEKYLPEVVGTDDSYVYTCRGDDDSILQIKGMKNIDPGKAAAALNGAAIKALHAIITKQDAIIAELQNRMKAIDGLDA